MGMHCCCAPISLSIGYDFFNSLKYIEFIFLAEVLLFLIRNKLYH